MRLSDELDDEEEKDEELLDVELELELEEDEEDEEDEDEEVDGLRALFDFEIFLLSAGTILFWLFSIFLTTSWDFFALGGLGDLQVINYELVLH